MPGIAGRETRIHSHRMVEGCYQEFTGVCEPNHLRADIENIAGIIGVDAVVNVVTNQKRNTVGVFVGDVVEAHRKGVEFAQKIYATDLVYDQDVIGSMLFPKIPRSFSLRIH